MSVTIEDDETDKLYIYRLATKVQLGDVIVVTGLVGTHQGGKQIAAGATAEIIGHVEIAQAEYVEVSIPEAYNTPDDTKVIIRGTVTEIETPWNSNYGNLSVYISDAEGNTFYIYRLKTNVEVGDVVTIKGLMGSYNGEKQIAAGATATITGKEVVVEPEAVEATIPEALALADGTRVIVNGTVKQINTAWSDSYQNITVTIEDEEGNTLYIYRLSTKVEAGDIITVTGKMDTYNGDRQIAQGATAVINGQAEPEETDPVETDPVETDPVETDPVETDPVETDPVETDPVETDPVETDPVETDPVETDPVETDPVETDPVETDPVETNPVETDPVETDPVETDPVETDPVETNPVETDPKAEQPTEAPAPTKDGGCGSSITGGALMISVLCMGLVAVVFKKKED